MRHTRRDACGMFLERCDAVCFEDIRIGYSYGMGLVAQCSRNLFFRRLCFAAPERSGRSSASAADMLHFSSCGGSIHLEHCLFRNPHDDPVNVHGIFYRVAEIRGPLLALRYAHPQTLGFPSLFPGDTLRFYNRQSLLPVAEDVRVLAVTGPDKDDLRGIRATLSATPTLPDPDTLVAQNMAFQPDLTIEHCRFEQIPTRGVLAGSGGRVLIQGNRFRHVAMAGVLIACDAEEWYEAGPVSDVEISRNTFTACGGPAVLVQPENTEQGARGVNHNIRIEDNRITELPVPVISIKSSDSVTVRRNRITPKQGESTTYKALIETRHASALLEENTIEKDG